MDDLFLFKQIIDSATSDIPKLTSMSRIPLFSFEGLPGAGKSTQIQKVSEALTPQYGKSRYIDLPTSSYIGVLLKTMYADHQRFAQISTSAPWLNPVLLSLDLALALRSMEGTDERFAIMSRGILSTYYYNIGPYTKHYADEQDAWQTITQHLNSFHRPSAIIFLEISTDEAYRRVVARNRGPLRLMDHKAQMQRDRETLSRYLTQIDAAIPVHYIDAERPEAVLTEAIIEVMRGYLTIRA